MLMNPTTRSESSNQDLDTLPEGSSTPASPVKAENQESTNAPNPILVPDVMEDIAAHETPMPDRGQSDRFQFPAWVTSYMDLDAEFKELCLNIQKAARMEARATEIRASLSQPEARTIFALIEELNGLEANPLRRELHGALDKLYTAMRRYTSATRLMQDFGLSVAPTAPLSQRTPAPSPFTMSGISPATGALAPGYKLVERPTPCPTMRTVITGAATEGQVLSPSPQATRALGNTLERVHDSVSSPSPTSTATPRRSLRIALKEGTDRSLPGTNSSRNVASGSDPPASQSHLTDEGNTQLDSQAATPSDNAQGSPDQRDKANDDGESSPDSSGEKPREPVYHQQPGESSLVAQTRFVQEFQEYENERFAYCQRKKTRLAHKRRRAAAQPSVNTFKRLRRGRRP